MQKPYAQRNRVYGRGLFCTTSLPWCGAAVAARKYRSPASASRIGGFRAHLFFHEYGRRVGMVPRSSLKGGKNSQMVEKGTEKPNTTQKQTKHHNPGPTGRVSTIM